MAAATREGGASYAVAYDPTGATAEAYGVRAYPTAYVIGRDGTVVWEGIPHFDPSAPERAMQAALLAPPR